MGIEYGEVSFKANTDKKRLRNKKHKTILQELKSMEKKNETL
tara:strand:- start:411 stop:536 length:126 start_codon:yes stop_codon:yes gene_type:complete